MDAEIIRNVTLQKTFRFMMRIKVKSGAVPVLDRLSILHFP